MAFSFYSVLNSNIDISNVFPDQIVIELEQVVNKFVPIVLENELKIKKKGWNQKIMEKTG